MKRFFNYLEEIRKQKKLTKTQLSFAAFGILLFLSLALTLPNYLVRQQQILRSKAQTTTGLPANELWREDLVSQVIGFGKNTTGGKGGDICRVTNLNDSG